jgi:hypothetical protein
MGFLGGCVLDAGDQNPADLHSSAQPSTMQPRILTGVQQLSLIVTFDISIASCCHLPFFLLSHHCGNDLNPS